MLLTKKQLKTLFSVFAAPQKKPAAMKSVIVLKIFFAFESISWRFLTFNTYLLLVGGEIFIMKQSVKVTILDYSCIKWFMITEMAVYQLYLQEEYTHQKG